MQLTMFIIIAITNIPYEIQLISIQMDVHEFKKNIYLFQYFDKWFQ